MSFRKDMIAAGTDYSSAVAVGGSSDLGVTLTTAMTTQATAYAITKANTVVTVSGATGNAAIIPNTIDQGDWFQVSNFTANALSIFPPVGWAIHGAAVNTAYVVAASKTASFTVVTNPSGIFPQGGLTYNQLQAQQG